MILAISAFLRPVRLYENVAYFAASFSSLLAVWLLGFEFN
jgi:hypothetical protein